MKCAKLPTESLEVSWSLKLESLKSAVGRTKHSPVLSNPKKDLSQSGANAHRKCSLILAVKKTGFLVILRMYCRGQS